jgi:penicillin-insensitive murein endopeptidase
VVPPAWVKRGAQWGVDELVDAVQSAAGRVAGALPGGVLGVGDLSTRGGGRATHHKSHVSGRDVDLIFYAVDDEGRPLPPPDGMPRYRRSLRSRAPRDGPRDYSGAPIAPRRFDLARNWALVAALVDDTTIDVEYVFISEPLRDKLLEFAAASGASAETFDRARRVLRSPGRRALPHDDHMHVRVRCSPADRDLGCVDEGRVRLRIERVPGPKLS